MAVAHVTVIGGGLAGSEAAFQLAVRGVSVTLVEMRPSVPSPAHHTDLLAELVCSNSMKADSPGRASAAGMLKTELEALGSLVMRCARATAVPAGGALAVDRVAFSTAVTAAVSALPGVDVVREEATDMPPGMVIVAAGPLASPALEPAISDLVGVGRLSFFDAAAPIVDADSIDMDVCFAASRYDKGGGADYLNCPFDREPFDAFAAALVSAARVTMREFETEELFAACQPIEEVVRRGADAVRFGAMKPVGLTDPRSGRRPWAVAQLRPENAARTAYNLVGFQTNLTFPEQRRVFRMIPGLAGAEFLRYGVMHRNTFVDSPRLLTPDLALRTEPRVRFAGQITGTEGYLEAAGSGLLAALGAYAVLAGVPAPCLPAVTVLGALIGHATDPGTDPYQPMHVNFGILPPLEPGVPAKAARYEAFAARGLRAVESFVGDRDDLGFAQAREALGVALPVGRTVVA
ncbi:MAG TPA: methylenetetrahydrofolate--tRNA-(uracil(54)-C(5))-methyltransferase (FADH(2)-oxidizing) TrmFO [Coriobacteriia bacterium]